MERIKMTVGGRTVYKERRVGKDGREYNAYFFPMRDRRECQKCMDSIHKMSIREEIKQGLSLLPKDERGNIRYLDYLKVKHEVLERHNPRNKRKIR